MASAAEKAATYRRSPAIEPGYLAGQAPANKGRTLPVEILTAEEVRALLAGCSGRAPTGIRNRALIAVHYRGGLRNDEALALMPKDVDARLGTIRVLHGKGDKARTLGLDPEAFALVDRWLDERRRLGLTARQPLFCTLHGTKLDDSYVRRTYRRLAAKAEIEKRVHPHAMRHTHTAELMRERQPLNLVQEQLGHSRLDTTQRYTRHVAPQDRIDAMRERTWDA